MDRDRSAEGRILWWRGILNGVLAWAIGFAILLLPGLVVGFRMGFELGPKINDSAAVSAEISRAVSGMYHESTAIAVGYPIVLAALVFWRSRRLATGSPEASIITGAIVGTLPAVMGVLSYTFGMGSVWSFPEAIVYIAAGAVGFRLARQRPVAVPQ